MFTHLSQNVYKLQRKNYNLTVEKPGISSKKTMIITFCDDRHGDRNACMKSSHEKTLAEAHGARILTGVPQKRSRCGQTAKDSEFAV